MRITDERFLDKSQDEYELFWRKIITFVDDFRRQPEPQFLVENEELTTFEGAFYAALVEELAKEFEIAIPNWVYKKKYYLDEPVFPNGLKGDSRIYVALEAPLAFKIRNIYIGKNTFYRC